MERCGEAVIVKEWVKMSWGKTLILNKKIKYINPVEWSSMMNRLYNVKALMN